MLDEDEVKSAPPEPPQHLPETLQVKWREIYAKAHARAQKDFDYESPTFQRQMALREANRLQEVEEPKSYEDAMKLQPHEFIHRQVGKRVVDTMTGEAKFVEDGKLHVVTSDGRKYQFPVPA